MTYQRALESLDELRARVLSDDVDPALSSRVDEAEALRSQAEEEALRSDYTAAMDRVERSTTAFRSVEADRQVLAGYRSAAEALPTLRRQARDPAARAEAERLESSAERALASGRYAEAVSLVEDAADAWRAAATAPEPPAAPPPSAIARDVLDDLAAAISSEEITRVRSIWTSITPEESTGLSTLFGAVRNLTVTYDVQTVTEEGDRIVVEVHTVYDFVAEQGGQQVREEIDQRFELGRRGDAWLVVGSE